MVLFPSAQLTFGARTVGLFDRMNTIQTNRDLYMAITDLVGEHKSGKRDLEEYLRSLWGEARRFSELLTLSANDFFGLLSAAFTQPAPPFNEEWRSQYEEHDPDAPGFSGWESFLLRQIIDLREMAEQGGLTNELRYFGINSPRGQRWFNFDPCTFLECATAGSCGGWQPGDDTGREYVPGQVAVIGDDGRITSSVILGKMSPSSRFYSRCELG